MNNMFLTVISICSFFCGCANSQPLNKNSKMKSVSYKLLNCLKDRDSICISSLFDNETDLNIKKNEIGNDCALVIKVISKYGIPSLNDFNTLKSKNGGNIAYVALLDKPDSALNLAKCHLVVYFYPDEFIGNIEKFYTYSVFEELLKKPIQKIIQGPEIKIN